MNTRFSNKNNNDNTASISPRRLLRLFAANERPRKDKEESILAARCDVAPSMNKNGTGGNHVTTNTRYVPPHSPASRKSKLPPSPSKKKTPLLPRTTRRSAPSPLLASSTTTAKESTTLSPPSPRSVVPPAPTLDSHRPSSGGRATRPGVSFQSHTDDSADPVAAKMSTFGRPSTGGGVDHSTSPMLTDPIVAKIAAHDDDNGNDNSRSPHQKSQDPLAPCAAAESQQPQQPQQQQQQQQQQQHQTMEIAPGQFVRLRGAKETWQCVENDAYLPTTCFACETDLCCIMDASYVLCPRCRVVSPVEGWAGGPDGGVGLGFTYEDLARWQHEIIQRRQQAGYY